MTDEMMDFRALVEKAPDADIHREMIAFAAEPNAVCAAVDAPRPRPRDRIRMNILYRLSCYACNWLRPGAMRFCKRPPAASAPDSSTVNSDARPARRGAAVQRHPPTAHEGLTDPCQDHIAATPYTSIANSLSA